MNYFDQRMARCKSFEEFLYIISNKGKVKYIDEFY